MIKEFKGGSVHIKMADNDYIDNTMVRASDYVVIPEERLSSGYTFHRGFPERKVIKENKVYRPRIIENIRMISGTIDVYEIW